MAATFPGWRPIAHQAHGEYHYARSDWEAVRTEFEAALALAAPGEFTRWPDVMARCLQTMVYQGEAEAACSRGRDALRDAKENDLSWLHCLSLRLAVGLAHVAAGQCEAGLTQIIQVQRECEERGVLDLYAGSNETLARAVLYTADPTTFEQALGQLAELVRLGQHPALLAKYGHLAEEGRRKFGFADDPLPEDRKARAEAISRVNAALRLAGSTEERVSRILELLLRETGATGGFLFGIRNRALVWLGSHDNSQPCPEIERAVQDYVAEAGTAMEMTMTLMSGTEPDRVRWMMDGRIYHPAPLTCQWKEEQSIAGVVALEAGDEGDSMASPALLTVLAEYLARTGDTTPAPWLD